MRQLVGGPFHGVRVSNMSTQLVMACPLECKEGALYEWDGQVYLHGNVQTMHGNVQKILALFGEFEEMVTKKQLDGARFKRDIRVDWLRSQRDKECDEHKQDWDEAIAKQSVLFPGDFKDATDGTSERDGDEGEPKY
jgi:hypothetical protein